MTAIPEPDTTIVAEPAPAAAPQPEPEGEAKPRDILIICYSGELEKVWAAMILATTGAAMGAKVRVFLTFWGLQSFVKDEVRITGDGLMQKMMSFMQRPGRGRGVTDQMKRMWPSPALR
jgi:peroxiredoxin family protein